MVNRLIEPSSGRVLVRGRPTADWDPIALRRSIGYVIQEGGLMPHLIGARQRRAGRKGPGARRDRSSMDAGGVATGAGRAGPGAVRSALPQAAQRRPASARGRRTCPGGQLATSS